MWPGGDNETRIRYIMVNLSDVASCTRVSAKKPSGPEPRRSVRSGRFAVFWWMSFRYEGQWRCVPRRRWLRWDTGTAFSQSGVRLLEGPPAAVAPESHATYIAPKVMGSSVRINQVRLCSLHKCTHKPVLRKLKALNIGIRPYSLTITS